MKKAEGYLLRALADEFVLVPYGKKTETVEEVITLSETAAFIYEQLETENSLDGIVQKVSEAYQVSKDVVYTDVQEVLRFLKDKGIVID